jgi:PEP-CTERM motif
MKKLITVLFATAISVVSYGQGEFAFAGAGARAVWDDFTGPTPTTSANISVAFLFGSTAATPQVDSIYTKTTTNGTTTLTQSQLTTAWTSILSDPNFILATNVNNSPVLAVGASTATGVYSYTPPSGTAGGAFAVGGSASAGATYNVFIIGWNNAGGLYLTPQAAALAGAAVGWSTVFNYAAAAGPIPGPAGTPGTFSAANTAQFGNTTGLQFGVIAAPVPEPGTMALAALGGASLLLFRRRK